MRLVVLADLDREYGLRLWDASGIWILELALWRWRLALSFGDVP